MSRKPSRQLDEAVAERLLRGETVTGYEPLARMLAAASAPGRAEELSGEPAARAAFRHARRVPGPSRRSSPTARSVLAKIFTIKAAAVMLAAGSIGGVTLAAGTGNLPTAPPRHTPESTQESARPTDTPRPAAPRPAPSAAPSRLLGLCSWYSGGVPVPDPRWSPPVLDPNLQDLFDMTGVHDRQQLDRFCEDLRRFQMNSNEPFPRPPGGDQIPGWPGWTWTGQPPNHWSPPKPPGPPTARSATPSPSRTASGKAPTPSPPKNVHP